MAGGSPNRQGRCAALFHVHTYELPGRCTYKEPHTNDYVKMTFENWIKDYAPELIQISAVININKSSLWILAGNSLFAGYLDLIEPRFITLLITII